MLSRLPVVSFWVTQSCSVGRGGEDISCSCDLQASEHKLPFLEQCPRHFPYTRGECKGGPRANTHPRDCQLHQNKLVSPLHDLHLGPTWAGWWFCTVQLRSIDSNKPVSWWATRKKLSVVLSELPACCWAGTFPTTELMQLLAAHGLRPRELLHPGIDSWMSSCAASQGWPWFSSSQRLVFLPSQREIWDSLSSFLIRSCSTDILNGTEQPQFLSQIKPLRCHTKHWCCVSLLITMSSLTLEIFLHHLVGKDWKAFTI